MKRRRFKKPAETPCPNCGKMFSKINAKYCSIACGRAFWEAVAPGKLAFLAGVRVGRRKAK